MVTHTEGAHAGEFIIAELPDFLSRGIGKFGESLTLVAGTVLGKIITVADAVATPSAAAANTGTATIAMGTPPLTSASKPGRYKGIAVTATTVRWEDPEGIEIGTSTHGAAFTKGGIKLTITAGGTANVAGDEFYVDVAIDEADEAFTDFDPAATDGSEHPAAILFDAVVTASGESARQTIVTHEAAVLDSSLVWPAGLTANQKAVALSDLAKLNIQVR